MNAASTDSNILNSVNSFGGNNQLNQLEENNAFNSERLGNLPVPELKLPKSEGSVTNNSTSNSTNNSKSSKVNFNFGDVNISNGMNFDEFAHKLMTLFTQGTSNSAQI